MRKKIGNRRFFRFLCQLLFGSRLPVHNATLTIDGINSALSIRRDSYGIPLIEAANDHDAWFGLGFCHAQDRAFQLETWRRIVSGTLSEIVGPKGLSVDRIARRIGFRRSALQQIAILDSDIRAGLDAYVAGINSGFANGLKERPHEFGLLGCRPGNWDAADAVGFVKLQSFLIPSNWDVELARLQLFISDGPSAVLNLDPIAVHPLLSIDRSKAAAAFSAIDSLAEELAEFLHHVPPISGSNNWVISGKRTHNGHPILANDPHMNPIIPSPWYLAQIRTPEWRLTGATAVGVPGFPAGHNGWAAWGSTAGFIDNTDLFLESISKDGECVEGKDGWTHCEIFDEVIHVKGEADKIERVLVTPRGPIISSALDDVNIAVSMQAIWLEPMPARGLLAIHRVKSFEEFRQCFSEWPFLSQHLVYADESGTIGWQLVGQTPIRRKGHGLVPLDAAETEDNWKGLIPFEQMPYLLNPSQGYIATANNSPIASAETLFLGLDWVDAYRASVISEAIEERFDWSVSSSLELQTSRRCKPWEEMKEIVLSVKPSDRRCVNAAEIFKKWDGKLEADSAAASLYVMFVSEMLERTIRAKAPKGFAWAFGRGFGKLLPCTMFADRRIAHLVRLMKEQPPEWFKHSWSEEIADALTQAISRIEEAAGCVAELAKWGEVRPLTLRHFILGESRLLSPLFNIGPMPWGGDENTPAQSSVNHLRPTDPPCNIPNLRMVLEVGNWGASRFIVAGGQSGNPISDNYDDQVPLWHGGKALAMPWTEEEIAAKSWKVLQLLPR